MEPSYGLVVQVPVERVVERIVEKPVERIVNQERIVHQERIIYQDRIVEVPVERRVEVVPTMFEAPPIQVQQVEYTDAPLQIHQQAPSYQMFRQQVQPAQFSSLVSVTGRDMYRCCSSRFYFCNGSCHKLMTECVQGIGHAAASPAPASPDFFFVLRKAANFCNKKKDRARRSLEEKHFVSGHDIC